MAGGGDVEGGPAADTPLNRTTSFNLRTAKITKESGGKDIFGILCGTVCCYLPCALATLAFVNAFSIFLIVIGAIHKDDCDARPNLGLVLIVSGSLAIVLSVLDSCIRTKASQGGEEAPSSPSGIIKMLQLFNSLIKIVKFGLFIYLCVMVYGLYADVTYEPGNLETYCNRTLFLVSFWTLTITFIILGLVILFSLCCCCCLIAAADK